MKFFKMLKQLLIYYNLYPSAKERKQANNGVMTGLVLGIIAGMYSLINAIIFRETYRKIIFEGYYESKAKYGDLMPNENAHYIISLILMFIGPITVFTMIGGLLAWLMNKFKITNNFLVLLVGLFLGITIATDMFVNIISVIIGVILGLIFFWIFTKSNFKEDKKSE